MAAHLAVSRQTVNAIETGKYAPSLPRGPIGSSPFSQRSSARLVAGQCIRSCPVRPALGA
ncbi:helix-turn-helix transcriptional regulator [Candidatus Chloroploca sp. Khr17]|uniref:helix-turn-helix transcriptional regulator n=1 Tax=Candidatus Chloroploca sp. Khr17 TaxID=2496869 RepID=UPI0035175877